MPSAEVWRGLDMLSGIAGESHLARQSVVSLKLGCSPGDSGARVSVEVCLGIFITWLQKQKCGTCSNAD